VNGPSESVVLPFPSDASINYIKDTYGNVENQKNDSQLIVKFSRPVLAGEQRTIILNAKSRNLVTDKGFFEYVWNVGIGQPVKLENVVILPEGSKSIKATPQAIIDNERPSVTWNFNQFSNGIFLLTYENNETNFAPIFAVLGIAVTVCCVAAFFIFRKKIPQAKQERAAEPIQDKEKLLEKVDLMNVKEKQVLQIIIEKGEANQYELRAKFNLTKSNLSKIVKSLEMKGLVKRERHGKINRLLPGERLK
ncbi:MAG: MarR family transcriptional regulator, partial [Nanoarchaeota archaeon]